MSIATFVVLVTLLSLGVSLLVTLVGVPILLATAYVNRWFADLERRRAAFLLQEPVGRRYRELGRPGFWHRVRVVASDPQTWKDYGWLVLLADAGFDVVAAVEDGSALVRSVVVEKPDVAVVDVRLPPSFRDEGLRAAIEARRRLPELAVLVLSQYVEQTYASELLADGRGGVGYLLKERIADPRDFVDAVRRVAEGGTALDPEVVRQLVARRGSLGELTPREREVLGLMAEGRSNSGIAAELVISESAVEKHVGRIFDKLRLPQTDSDHRRVLAVLAHLNDAG
jgi:DNA-binding NarL/FixJ family response regulator